MLTVALHRVTGTVGAKLGVGRIALNGQLRLVAVGATGRTGATAAEQPTDAPATGD